MSASRAWAAPWFSSTTRRRPHLSARGSPSPMSLATSSAGCRASSRAFTISVSSRKWRRTPASPWSTRFPTSFIPARRLPIFLHWKKIGKRLAGMKLVGKRVDHGDAGVRRHFLEDTLMVNARDDALHPALEVASDIGDGLPRAERCGRLRVVEENHGAAHALDADIEGDTRAERGLLKNQRDEFAVERGGVTAGASLDIRRELEQFARVRGTPFRPGEEIIRQGNRCNQRRSGHFFTLPPQGRRARDSRTCRNPKRRPALESLQERVQRA